MTNKEVTKNKVFLRTFGCQMNVRDSEVIAGLLLENGYKLADDEKVADVVLFNTCSVRQHAEDKVWSEIGRVAKRGQSPSPRLRSGQAGTVPLIGVVGCMAQNYKEKIFERAPSVDFVVGPSDIDKIPEIIRKVSGVRCQVSGEALFETKIWETDGQTRPEEIYHTSFYEDKNQAYVVISEGCSNFCSYCVVPYVRGELHNRNYKYILKEIEEGIDKGITKITLLGQNVNAYEFGVRGSELGVEKEVNFVKLLELINQIKGLKEFDFITSHPKDVSVDLFTTMAVLERLKKTLHLPMQAGSNKILKLMNRGYTRERYLDLVEKYRHIIPEGHLSTDVMVGFPTEKEEDFLETYDLMEKIKFNSAYIFKYSPRPNTEAEKLPDDVPKQEKEKRHKTLLDFQKDLWRKRSVSAIICALLSVSICVSSRAMLDIFDHPKEIEQKKKVTRVEEQVKFLDYPRECFLKGNYEETFSTCQKLVNYPAAQRIKGEILYLLGLSCLKLGRPLEARSYFNDVILVEGEKADLKTDAYLGIADAYFLEERLDKAFDAYKQVLATYPNSPVGAIVYYRLGEISYKMERPEEARRYLDTVIKEFPFSFEARLAGDLVNKCNSFVASVNAPVNNEEPYGIQVGCFNEKGNADKICERLIREGFESRIIDSGDNNKPRFRVVVGRCTSKQEAETLETKLKKAGYSTKICP